MGLASDHSCACRASKSSQTLQKLNCCPIRRLQSGRQVGRKELRTQAEERPASQELTPVCAGSHRSGRPGPGQEPTTKDIHHQKPSLEAKKTTHTRRGLFSYIQPDLPPEGDTQNFLSTQGLWPPMKGKTSPPPTRAGLIKDSRGTG